MDKSKGVMTALKGRKGFGSKKGVALLGIVQKLTEKRKAMKDGSGGCGKKDGVGGPGWDKIKQFGKGVAGGLAAPGLKGGSGFVKKIIEKVKAKKEKK